MRIPAGTFVTGALFLKSDMTLFLEEGSRLLGSGCVDANGSILRRQDDCIAVKSGRNEEGRLVGIASEHIRVTNCTFTSGFGMAMGSEMSGGIRDCLVQDCVFSDVYSIGSIKTPRGRGGAVENIVYENLRHQNLSHEHQDCKWFRGAIYVDEF